ncbi:hypothetical protein [Bryobacter aggregatus]|uniref:hypothetical protein n=1 Tax=Bryobacter aggregatus TaxID=360054 RepID=UPI0004E190D5|nr:hypothetical protein [Bryobacter aggregatus]
MRGLLNWRAPLWAQVLVSGASLLVAVLRVNGAFRRRGITDVSMLLVAGLGLVLLAYLGLRANRSGSSDWGWGAVMGYGVFGAVLIGISLRLAIR